MKVYRPGLTVEACQKEVEEILKKQGFDLTKDYFKRMRGGFGHYVGMAVHDVGGRIQALKPGMIFANEPLMTWPNENLGVRVEDTILITETGCENLTAGIPRTVKDIEELMKNPGIPQILKKAAQKE
jgi:Xaa-Pro aminopeptidase